MASQPTSSENAVAQKVRRHRVYECTYDAEYYTSMTVAVSKSAPPVQRPCVNSVSPSCRPPGEDVRADTTICPTLATDRMHLTAALASAQVSSRPSSSSVVRPTSHTSLLTTSADVRFSPRVQAAHGRSRLPRAPASARPGPTATASSTPHASQARACPSFLQLPRPPWPHPSTSTSSRHIHYPLSTSGVCI
jgi:hypothetical protein